MPNGPRLACNLGSESLLPGSGSLKSLAIHRMPSKDQSDRADVQANVSLQLVHMWEGTVSQFTAQIINKLHVPVT